MAAPQDPTVSTESNGSALVVTAIVMLSLTWFSSLLRTYVRTILVKSFQTDDWMLLLAQINFTISCGFILRGCYHGLGRHNMSLPQWQEIKALQYQALATATYVANMWLIKMSIAIFLLRIAIQRRYQYTIYASMGVVTVWSLALFFWDVFQCNPVQAQWDYRLLEDPAAHCASADAVVMAAYALSVMNILSDWLYALLPIPMIWNVKMTIEAKITVSLVLGLGIFASIATLVRLRFLADLTDTEDILYAGTEAMVWTLIEPGVAIVATSLATIRPLLRAMGIRGFQVTEYSRQALGISGGNNTGRGTNHSAKRGFGSVNGPSTDIELGGARGGRGGSKGRGPGAGLSRTISDPGKPASRPPKSKFPPRRMASVSEGQQRQQKKTNSFNKIDANIHENENTDDNSSEKPLHPDFEEIDVQSLGRTPIAAPAPVFQQRRTDRQDTPIPGELMDQRRHINREDTPSSGGVMGTTWLDSSDQLDQFPSRDSSVDFPALQPEHSQSDMRMGLGTPYRR